MLCKDQLYDMFVIHMHITVLTVSGVLLEQTLISGVYLA